MLPRKDDAGFETLRLHPECQGCRDKTAVHARLLTFVVSLGRYRNTAHNNNRDNRSHCEVSGEVL